MADIVDEPDPASLSRLEALRERYAEFAEEHPIAATTAETIGIYAVSSFTRTQLNSLYNDDHNPHFTRYAESPLASAITAVVAAPIVEELAYREAPSHVADRYPGLEGILKWTSAAVFYSRHVSDQDDSPPVEAVPGSMYLWGVRQKRGVGHAMYAHALYNALNVLRFEHKRRK